MKKLRNVLILALAFALVCTSMAFAEDLSTWAMETPVTVTVMKNQNPATVSYANGEDATNNIYYNAYRDELGITMDFQIYASGDEYSQKLTMAIASNDLPDLLYLPMDQYVQLARAGKLWDMGPVLEEYASDLTKQCMNSDGGTLLEAAKVDGTLYCIPVGNAQRIPSQYLWIRKDWLTKLGLETPKTFDDVVAIAREFKNNDPDGNGENDTWGLGLCNEMSDYSGFGTAEGVLNAFGGSLLQQIWVADENGNLVYMPPLKAPAMVWRLWLPCSRKA